MFYWFIMNKCIHQQCWSWSDNIFIESVMLEQQPWLSGWWFDSSPKICNLIHGEWSWLVLLEVYGIKSSKTAMGDPAVNKPSMCAGINYLWWNWWRLINMDLPLQRVLGVSMYHHTSSYLVRTIDSRRWSFGDGWSAVLWPCLPTNICAVSPLAVPCTKRPDQMTTGVFALVLIAVFLSSFGLQWIPISQLLRNPW